MPRVLVGVSYPKYESGPLPGTTAEQIRFNEIREAILPVFERLQNTSREWFSVGNYDKAVQIKRALVRLAEAIILKEDKEGMHAGLRDYRLTPISVSEMRRADFSTIDSMLDLNFGIFVEASTGVDSSGMDVYRPAYWSPQLSLREALNISRLNIFNLPAIVNLGIFGPLSGRSSALVSVEETLRRSHGART